MRDSKNVFECVPKDTWGSQGQPVFPTTNNELVTEGFKYFLDILALGTEEAKARAGLAAKARYVNKLQPMWYHML